MTTLEDSHMRVVRNIPERTGPERQMAGGSAEQRVNGTSDQSTHNRSVNQVHTKENGAAVANGIDPYKIDPDLIDAGRDAAEKVSSQGEQAVLDGYWLLGQWARAQAAQSIQGATMGLDPLANLGGHIPDWISRMGLDSSLVGRYVQWWIDYLSGAMHATNRFYDTGMHGYPHHHHGHHPMPPWLNSYYQYPHHGYCPPPGYPPPGGPGIPPFPGGGFGGPNPGAPGPAGASPSPEHFNAFAVFANAEKRARNFGGAHPGAFPGPIPEPFPGAHAGPATPPPEPQPATPPPGYEMAVYLQAAKPACVYQQWFQFSSTPASCQSTASNTKADVPEVQIVTDADPIYLSVTVSDKCAPGTYTSSVLGAQSETLGQVSVEVQG